MFGFLVYKKIFDKIYLHRVSQRIEMLLINEVFHQPNDPLVNRLLFFDVSHPIILNNKKINFSFYDLFFFKLN